MQIGATDVQESDFTSDDMRKRALSGDEDCLSPAGSNYENDSVNGFKIGNFSLRSNGHMSNSSRMSSQLNFMKMIDNSIMPISALKSPKEIKGSKPKQQTMFNMHTGSARRFVNKSQNNFTDALMSKGMGNRTAFDLRQNDISKDQPSITEEVDSDNTIDQEERKGTDLHEDGEVPIMKAPLMSKERKKER